MTDLPGNYWSLAVNDYPAMIAAANHVEPVPRRIRAFLALSLIHI